MGVELPAKAFVGGAQGSGSAEHILIDPSAVTRRWSLFSFFPHRRRLHAFSRRRVREHSLRQDTTRPRAAQGGVKSRRDDESEPTFQRRRSPRLFRPPAVVTHDKQCR